MPAHSVAFTLKHITKADVFTRFTCELLLCAAVLTCNKVKDILPLSLGKVCCNDDT